MFAINPQPPTVLGDYFSGPLFHQIPKELRPGNPERDFWSSWRNVINLYGFNCSPSEYQHAKCWGWTILRASYDDDEAFHQAVNAIHRLALIRLEDEYRQSRTTGQPGRTDMDAVMAAFDKVDSHPGFSQPVQQTWKAMVTSAQESLPEGEVLNSDRVITHALVRCYHNIVLQDEEALDGAGVATAWGYANATDIEKGERGGRGELFIYLDKESTDSLAKAPSQEELAKMTPEDRSKTAWQFWVKVVSYACEVTEDGDDTNQMMEVPWGRRRLRLYDFFESFIDLCNGSLDEMGVEGQNRELFEGPVGRWVEWEFCDAGMALTTLVREPWLYELYGEVVS